MFNNNNSSNPFSGGSGNSGSIFNKGQQGTSGGMFNQNQNQQTQGNIFANKTGTGTGGGTGGLFSGQTGGSGNLFSNNQQTSTSGNLFNTQGGSGNLFSSNNNQSSGNLFGQSGNPVGSGTGTQYGSYGTYGSYGQQGMPTNPAYFSQVNEAQFQHLLSEHQDKHKKLFEAFSSQYIRNLISHYRKCLEPSKVEKIQISAENPLKNEKLSKAAASMNMKKEVIQIKRLIRDNVKNKVDKLKAQKTKMQDLSMDFSKKVFQKLQKYKQKLVFAVTQKKMIEEIKKEVDQIDQQIKQFFKPLFNSYQNRNNYSFTDPDPFCLKVAEICLKNMTVLDNKMDELLACQSQSSDQNLQTAQVIRQLVEYYENVAITVKQFTEKFNGFKIKVARKSNQANPDDLLKEISKKANASMNKDMQSYQLVKEVESLLSKRDAKIGKK